MTREATFCQNILNALPTFARVSNFRCFYETKQAQNVVGRFFYNLAEFVFEYYFCDSRRILATFAKFCLNSFFGNMIVPLPQSQTRHQARAQGPPPSPIHAFLTQQNFTNPSPCSQFFFALTRSPSLRTKTACQELIPEAF